MYSTDHRYAAIFAYIDKSTKYFIAVSHTNEGVLCCPLAFGLDADTAITIPLCRALKKYTRLSRSVFTLLVITGVKLWLFELPSVVTVNSFY